MRTSNATLTWKSTGNIWSLKATTIVTNFWNFQAKGSSDFEWTFVQRPAVWPWPLTMWSEICSYICKRQPLCQNWQLLSKGLKNIEQADSKQYTIRHTVDYPLIISWLYAIVYTGQTLFDIQWSCFSIVCLCCRNSKSMEAYPYMQDSNMSTCAIHVIIWTCNLLMWKCNITFRHT